MDIPANFEASLRRIIREEVRPLVRQETQDLRDNVSAIQHLQYEQNVQADVRGLKTSVRTHGVLLEDLEARFSACNEAYGL